ncbi:MAG: hypothetical protein ACI9R3_000459 [Verrucomicrobiales bacterium]|jgi:hypothetical protein
MRADMTLIRSKPSKSYGNDLEFYQTARRAKSSRHFRGPVAPVNLLLHLGVCPRTPAQIQLAVDASPSGRSAVTDDATQSR